MMAKSPLIGVVSGYFNPLGSHHLKYFSGAWQHLDSIPYNGPKKLIAIINNDAQLIQKGSLICQNENERMEIVGAIRYIEEVVLSIDEDSSVAKTLELIKPDYFYNGGDRIDVLLNPKELEVCAKIGCGIITGIGGPKTGSSSSILNKVILGFKVKRLLDLKKNWNSYEADVILPKIVQKTLILINKLNWITGWQVAPTIIGGVQLEYHRDDRDIEIEFMLENICFYENDEKTIIDYNDISRLVILLQDLK